MKIPEVQTWRAAGTGAETGQRDNGRDIGLEGIVSAGQNLAGSGEEQRQVSTKPFIQPRMGALQMGNN